MAKANSKKPKGEDEDDGDELFAVKTSKDSDETKSTKVRRLEKAVEKIFAKKYPQASHVRATMVTQVDFRVNVFERFRTKGNVVPEHRIIHSDFFYYLASPSPVSDEPAAA